MVTSRSLTVTAVQRPSIRPDAQVDGGVLATLGATIPARETLRFDYVTGDDHAAAAARRAEPHHLVTWGRRWYLVGVGCRPRRLAYISRRPHHSAHSQRAPFHPEVAPGDDLATFVTRTFRGGADASGAWPCRGEVVLDLLAAEVATYTPDGIVEPFGPDRCRLTQESWSWVSLAASIGRFDADIEVIGPDELRDAFATLGRTLSTLVRCREDSRLVSRRPVTMPSMRMRTVVSDSVRAVGYQPSTRTLRIEFLHGGIYDYAAVAPALFEEMLRPHPWSRVGQTVKTHACTKVSG